MKLFRNNAYLGIFTLSVLIFFAPFVINGKLPVPSDALVGLYHPWRDKLALQYPQGFPYKNPLITDPVRQQIPYRKQAIDELKQGILPKWNPFSFSGTPLLANIQTGSFYPLNLVFWVLPFPVAWSVLVMLQPLLAGWLMYAYLRSLNLSQRASFIGSLSFAFSGFMVSWMEWNTIGQTAMWLPLILLAKDKLLRQFTPVWSLVLIFAETAMLLAGHLQTAFYVLAFSTAYLIIKLFRICKVNKKAAVRKFGLFVISGAVVLTITSIQWLPAAKFIFLSARNFDLADWHRPDWFIPWQHLAQFIAPDFFGNPATGNYYGIWNYGEFVGYIALFPLLMAVFALLARRDKKTFFFGATLLGAIILAVPNFVSYLPYNLKIPFLSTLQPSRIMILVDFSLAVLSGLGLDYIVKPEKEREKRIRRVIIFAVLAVGLLWLAVWLGPGLGVPAKVFNTRVAGRNLAFPSGLLLVSIFGILGLSRFAFKKIILTRVCVILLLGVTLFDLYRFFNKFIPFTDQALFFPQTDTIRFLQENLGNSRFMSADSRILPPDTSVYYNLQNVDGYDPLYLLSYGYLGAAWVRNRPDIAPVAFNRIITPQKTDSFITDLLGVKYVLSLADETSPKLKLVFREGQTRVYENSQAYPRAYLAEAVSNLSSDQEVIREMFTNQTRLKQTVFTSEKIYVKPMPLLAGETAIINQYLPDYVKITTLTQQPRLLVLTDIFYPDWKVFINGKESAIFPIDLALRGIIVPEGETTVEFRI